MRPGDPDTRRMRADDHALTIASYQVNVSPSSRILDA